MFGKSWLLWLLHLRRFPKEPEISVSQNVEIVTCGYIGTTSRRKKNKESNNFQKLRPPSCARAPFETHEASCTGAIKLGKDWSIMVHHLGVHDSKFSFFRGQTSSLVLHLWSSVSQWQQHLGALVSLHVDFVVVVSSHKREQWFTTKIIRILPIKFLDLPSNHRWHFCSSF